MICCDKLCALLTLAAVGASAQVVTLDLATTPADPDVYTRIRGSSGNGAFGVPVASGFDCDGDGFVDSAMAAMRASPLGRPFAGEVLLIFGDGTIGGEIHTSSVQPRVLRIAGSESAPSSPSPTQGESTGNEIVMEDVTGDGIGDLLICRQNFTPGPGRRGAGAVSVVVGGPSLRAFADTLAYLDLSSPPPSVSVVTLVGSSELDRLGIWVRTGDVDDDGIADMVIGADQANHGTSHTGEVYVVRGGSHLAATQTLDMAQFGTGAFGGNVMRITGPTAAGDGHFGATCLIGDVDGNGKSEVLASTTLSRVSAGIRPVGATDSAHSTGGFAPGILWIAWDDNFPATPWPAAFEFSVDAPPATLTRIIGPNGGGRFGEELFTGLDLDASGSPDLFVGDLQSDNTLGSNRVRSGSGHVFWESDELRTGNLDLRTPPPGFVFSVIVGPHTGAIGGDTAAAGDFDGDGIDDLVFAAPDDSPDGRIVAGSVYVLFGREGGWPTYVDTAPGEIPPPEMVRVVWVKGANFTIGSNLGDILGYSAACGDINGDGLSELILNEMGGDAVSPEMEDVGTLLLIGGRTVTGQSMTAVGVQLR